MTTRDSLTEQELVAFAADGFLPLGPFIDGEQLSYLRTVYDKILAQDLGDRLPGKGPDGTAVSLLQVPRPEQLFPELWQTPYFTRARRIAAQLLDTPESELDGNSHLTYKQPRTGRDTPWHQDEASWLAPELATHEPRAVTFWITLDDATPESGCMSFIPGSHTRTERHVFADDETSFLTVAEPDTAAARQVPMRAGEASIHHCRTVHHATANTSDRQRRAWPLEFAAAPVPRTGPDTRDWLPELRERMAHRAQLGLI
jgi:phytanoyl-CoA hydroxylase